MKPSGTKRTLRIGDCLLVAHATVDGFFRRLSLTTVNREAQLYFLMPESIVF